MGRAVQLVARASVIFVVTRAGGEVSARLLQRLAGIACFNLCEFLVMV